MAPAGQEAVHDPGSASEEPQRHRRHYREKLRRTAYLNLDDSNGGVLRDLSEAGVALQAVAPLHLNQRLQLHLELPAPRMRVTVMGRVAWSDSNGQGGVEFLEVPARSRRLLKQWLFTQLLVRAYEASRRDSIFAHWKQSGELSELSFSAAARPAIPLGPPIKLLPSTSSQRYLARLADGIILFLAALLFLAVSFALTRVALSWLFACALVFTVIFGTLYWGVFAAAIGATPGKTIVRMLFGPKDGPCDEGERFR